MQVDRWFVLGPESDGIGGPSAGRDAHRSCLLELAG